MTCTAAQGTLAQLDSQTPVMYLDCPGGRIKLFGRLTFLRNKYISLRVGASQAWCEDIFDMLVRPQLMWCWGTVRAESGRACTAPAAHQLVRTQH